MKARDFRAKAVEALKGNWWVAILTTFLATLLGALGGGGGSGGRAANTAAESVPSMQDLLSTPEGRRILAVLGVLSVFAVLFGLCKLILGGTLNLGFRTFTLNLVDGKPAHVDDMFSKFNMFGKGFLMQLLLGLYLALWTLLFIVPGIIKSFSYAMTPYILTEHPEMTVNEAITASRELMNGNKWRLFCLNISFFGWAILCILTLGIGALWLNPYIQVSNAAFYRQICAEKQMFCEGA